MSSMTLIGIDPGLVDSGVVRLTFYPSLKRVSIRYAVATTFDLDTTPQAIGAWVQDEVKPSSKAERPHIYIEKYNPRPGMSLNQRMTDIQRTLMLALPDPVLVNNTGIKQIITQELMERLQVWHFGISTRHQDLRSAARIALYGGAKDPDLNPVIAEAVAHHGDWAFDLMKGDKL